MKKHLLYLSFIFLSLSGSSQAWTGEEDQDWNNPCNWSDWPLDGKLITIDPAHFCGECSLPEIRTASVFTPTLVTVQNGASLFIGSDLTVLEDLNVFDECSQVYFQKGRVSVGASNGRLIVADGSTVIMHDGSLSISRPVLVEQGGKFIQDGGMLHLEQAVPPEIIPASALTGTHTE